MQKIVEPLQLRHLQVKNRLARSAVHSFLGNPDGTMTEAEYAMYESLAKGGVGLIVTGHCSVAVDARANDNQTGLHDDSFIGQFEKLRDLVHAHGVKLIAQINHAGPRAVDCDDPADVSARELKKGRYARALTLDEIHTIERQFIDAAVRVRRAGLDGVQLHAAHSYLLSRFLDETFNQRTDDYGGAIENRFRVVERILGGIRAACGPEFPIFIKINNDTETNDARYESDLKYMLARAAEYGVEAVELSGCDFLAFGKDDSVYYLERAKQMAVASSVPLMLVGGVRTLADMERVLESGIAMVSLGRPLISEPDLFEKLLNGQERSQCVCCNRCFVLPKIKPGVRCVLHRKTKATKAE